MKGKILIIDDDPNARMILSRILKKEDYEICEAENGKRGLEAAREFEPNVIIVDWMMPEMDGEQFSRIAKSDQKLKQSHIILLTAKGDTVDIVRGLDAGADDYIIKPAQHPELLARVRTGMRLKNLKDEIHDLSHRVAVLEMAATVGHEINNPLNVLFLALDLLRSTLKTRDLEKMQRAVDLIAESAERLKLISRKFTELKEPARKTYVNDLNMIDIHGEKERKEEK
ncbi:MAG: response regulator [Candidatus Kryptoniota bacterium]